MAAGTDTIHSSRICRDVLLFPAICIALTLVALASSRQGDLQHHITSTHLPSRILPPGFDTINDGLSDLDLGTDPSAPADPPAGDPELPPGSQNMDRTHSGSSFHTNSQGARASSKTGPYVVKHRTLSGI